VGAESVCRGLEASAGLEAVSGQDTPPLHIDDERGLLALRRIDLTRVPGGVELTVRMLKTSTGKWRLRVHIGNDKAKHELGDKVMSFDDLVVDMHVFSSENMAHAVLRQQDSGAGKRL
jgi:hypothetical protein